MFPLEWDFSNLEEIFETYIKNHRLRNTIILSVRKLTRESISEKGMDKFCNWFIKQIQ